jgi:putative protease
MSYAIGGRSGNRGECAQPCRRRYRLVDRDGRSIAEDRHWLSLRDLNLSDHLDGLLDAGITSFKIEGRLKDRAYVANVVSWYRQRLDSALAARGWRRSSSGDSSAEFEPALNKTFNRSFTSFFVQGRQEAPGAIDSPKMVGEYLGTVTTVQDQCFALDAQVSLHSGDGLCWFDANQDLSGTTVNGARTGQGMERHTVVTPARMTGIREGLQVFRNRDHAFLKQVERGSPERRIGVRLCLECTGSGFALHAEDEDGNRTTAGLTADKVPAVKPDQAGATARKQLGKSGESIFRCTAVDLAWDRPYFLPVGVLNALRRETLERLGAVREANRPAMTGGQVRSRVPFPESELSYQGNVLNRKAEAFYQRHGVQKIAPAAESGLDMRGKPVMRTRYCIRHQLGLCDGKHKSGDLREPLYLVDQDEHSYRLRFDCEECEMEVLY